MAQRTDPASVQAVMPYQWDGTTSVQPFIDTASPMVDWLVGLDTDAVLNSTLQERIECYLAAHFYCCTDKAYQTKMTGRASGQFQGQTGQGLASTDFGQMAMRLDITGRLSQQDQDALLGRRRVATIKWIGNQSQAAPCPSGNNNNPNLDSISEP